jgi:Protein of unknown function (DUF3108)
MNTARLTPHPTAFVLVFRRLAALLLGGLIGATIGAQAQAQGSLTAQYTIAMTGVSIGQIVWTIEIGDTRYTTSAAGKASGVLSVLVNGEGSVKTDGSVADGKLVPAEFNSSIVDDDGKTELEIAFANGGAQERIVQGAPPPKDRLPVTDADRRGVSDPLSAMLIPVKPGGDFQAKANCDHVLMIFDGRRRYDLALSFQRIDKFKSKRGYAGPVLVCGVILKPIAGYKPDSLLVKYVAGRRDMELWFAPIAGTSIMAPIHVAMPTLIGTLKIEANQFEVMAARPAPTPAPVTSEPLPPLGLPPPAIAPPPR